jgi:hypothetical protein
MIIFDGNPHRELFFEMLRIWMQNHCGREPAQWGAQDMVKFLLWCILLVLCWPLALVALVLYPLVWLVLLPFRIVGIAVGGALELVSAIIFLPVRLLKTIWNTGFAADFAPGKRPLTAVFLLLSSTLLMNML